MLPIQNGVAFVACVISVANVFCQHYLCSLYCLYCLCLNQYCLCCVVCSCVAYVSINIACVTDSLNPPIGKSNAVAASRHSGVRPKGRNVIIIMS